MPCATQPRRLFIQASVILLYNGIPFYIYNIIRCAFCLACVVRGKFYAFDFLLWAVYNYFKLSFDFVKRGGETVKPQVPEYCLFRGCYNPDYERETAKCKKKCSAYNKLAPGAKKRRKKILRSLLGKTGELFEIMPPFWCDYGYNIEIGERFYANHNLIITDGAKVKFGSDVFIAPNCCFTTAEHPVHPEQRKRGWEIAKPITVGDNVWIGAGSVVLAGVTIGDGSVIGAGSVVTKSVPPGVVAAGVPCRVMRNITEADKTRYPLHESLMTGKEE